MSMAAKAKSKVARAAPVAMAERWTAAKREAFLRALVETANVVGAARTVGRWRLSALWRGRRGTEWAITSHPSGAAFVLLEALALARLNATSAVTNVKVMAVGVGDITGANADGPPVVGASVRPLSPVNPVITVVGPDRMTSWTRRSRDGWQWRDGVDAPIEEESERYRVTKLASGRPDLVVETSAPEWTYTGSERAADFAAGATQVTISVVQIGALSVSQPLQLTISTS
jgi:hypothetical protein